MAVSLIANNCAHSAAEHARLVGAQPLQVVHQHAHERFGARDHERILPSARRRRPRGQASCPIARCVSSTLLPLRACYRKFGRARTVGASDEALRCRLLIAGRAVDLPGEVEPGAERRLQARQQLLRRDVVVLNAVAGGTRRDLNPTVCTRTYYTRKGK